MRQQSDSAPGERRPLDGGGIVGAKPAPDTDSDLGARIARRSAEPPDVIAAPAVIDDAIVPLEIPGMSGGTASLQVARRCDQVCRRPADAAGD